MSECTPTGSEPAGSAMLPAPPVRGVDPRTSVPCFKVTVPVAEDGVTVTGTEPAAPVTISWSTPLTVLSIRPSLVCTGMLISVPELLPFSVKSVVPSSTPGRHRDAHGRGADASSNSGGATCWSQGQVPSAVAPRNSCTGLSCTSSTPVIASDERLSVSVSPASYSAGAPPG